MTVRYLALAAVSLLAVAATSVPPVQAASTPNLCAPGEQPVLSCGVGGKVLSLCASGSLTAEGAGSVKMQYRFGRKGAVEMAWPVRPEHPRGLFFLSTTMFSGGGEERIRFSNGGYDYVVFQRTIAGSRDEDGVRGSYQDEGVAVLKAGKVVGRHICTTPAVNDGYPKMYDVLEREDGEALDIPCCGEK
ncbi:MAG: hypothetical protein Q8L23_02295 [Caulobacter sp.]|nr:hypothetical protein [Caulobacter sp.]